MVILALGSFGIVGFTFQELEIDTTKGPSKVLALKTPGGIAFAGEPMPMDDREVKERFDRELHVNTYWQSNTMLYFKRAAQYFPTIEPILHTYGIPEDFKYLAVAESALQNVVSPSGATGFWQIMSGTARDYGLEVNDVVDERYHVEKSTEAACKYLLNAYEVFGNWTAVAASYNMGVNGLLRQMKRQKCTSYYDLLLNSETSRYVFRIMAIKEILENPPQYGFSLDSSDLYLPEETRKIILEAPNSDLAFLAQSYGISYKTLKYHNPWLRDNFLKAEKEQYEIRLPLNAKFNPNFSYPNPISHLDSLVYYAPKIEFELHKVRRGESLSGIAAKYGVSLGDLYEWNDLDNKSVLKVGQEIRINSNK